MAKLSKDSTNLEIYLKSNYKVTYFMLNFQTLKIKGNKMNKSEFIASVAAKAELSKKDAGAAVDAALATITETLAKGDTVAFVGFGTFSTSARAAREGRNPSTGEAMKIAATTVAKFKAGKALKDAVAK
jgi:DNA-binding protein HU-beta